MDASAARRDKLRKAMKKAGVDALLVTNYSNVTYLTGFTGDSSYLLIMPKGELLFSDSRFTTQLEEECPGLDVDIRVSGVKITDRIKAAVEKAKLSRLGIESATMTVALCEKLHADLPKVELVSTASLVETLRMIKDKGEIEAIRHAVWCAERAFGVLRASIHPAQTEKEVADELEHQIRRFGGKRAAFETIVAVGPRAALPHARPTQARVAESDFVLVDWGADGGLYKSDLTRVLVTGKIPPKLERVYGVVLTAQEQAIAAIRPGVTCEQVDRVARDIIAKAGFGQYFGHGLGHAIGLDIHEWPRFAAGETKKLEPGMVMTVEPGIYLPGWGGVRIEDDILVTKTGHEVLTSVPKRWEDAIL